MKVLTLTLSVVLALAGLSGCKEHEKNAQSKLAQQAADSIKFTENAEIINIKARLELTSSLSKIGYIVLMNQSGQPVAYHTVKGKVTSGGKRLTSPQQFSSGGVSLVAPSDEGTYGSSGEYIFFWTPQGQYVQWNGNYLYSDQPIRLRIEPLIITTENK